MVGTQQTSLGFKMAGTESECPPQNGRLVSSSNPSNFLLLGETVSGLLKCYCSLGQVKLIMDNICISFWALGPSWLGATSRHVRTWVLTMGSYQHSPPTKSLLAENIAAQRAGPLGDSSVYDVCLVCGLHPWCVYGGQVQGWVLLIPGWPGVPIL